MSDWTPDRVNILLDCVEKRLSAKDASNILGITRMAAIGKARRIGYRFHSAGDVLERRAKPKSNGRQVPVNIRNTRNRSSGPDPQPPLDPDIPPTIDDLNIPIDQRRSILTVKDTECKFTIGEPKDPTFFLCGAPVQEGSSFCAAHHARCYTRPVSHGGQFRLPR